MDKMNILYEDNHIIVVEKPVNVPTQGDETGDLSLLDMVKAYVKEKYNKPGDVFIGLVHRLDRPVGGVMVFARTSKAASRLVPQFAEKNRQGAEKKYAAVVLGEAPDRGSLEDWLLRDDNSHSTLVVKENTDNAKMAVLDYRTAARRKGMSLLDVDLKTGRHHQIRVQLSNAGFPIWGDQRYNTAAVPGQQIALYAYSLSFEHPVTHERMRFTSVPDYGAFRDFGDEIRLMAADVDFSYVDKDILVLNKPSGVTVAERDGGGDNLETRLKNVLPEVYPVHRLDAVTTGLVIFARNINAKDALDAAIRERTIKKYYRLIVRGCPEKKSGTLDLWAVKSGAEGFVRVYDEKRPGAVEMVTEYRVIKSEGGASLVEALLVTGRTHQLRASFAHIGCPILGDDKYGSREFNRDPGFRKLHRRDPLCLAAVRIVFAFPEGSYLVRLNGMTVEKEAPFDL
ncbi:MAG: hypothetical protein K6F68_02775 [Clostridiales bacterium]|nr:hypothetical protein [Clostridiales bacterium]